ncbi:MAG: FkbM family methyltransferase, partial [Beijerinckiaceae bacterium]|nr:FkbM family methyltransferase [Beijerinckiaceae bacterium]
NDHGIDGGARFDVETIALDDFVDATGLMPSFIKMDIEGAEYDALQGARKLIAEGKPTLVLEQSPTDMRCHDLLTSAGYIAIDLNDYRRIHSAADFPTGVGITNILFVHTEKAANDIYVHAGEPNEIMKLPADAFLIQADGSLALKERITLKPGRYVCKAHFSADGTDNEIFAGIESQLHTMTRYHTYTKMMAENYRDWVFSLRTETQVTPYIQFIRGADPSLHWRSVTILKYPGFDRMPPSLIS